MARLSIEEKTKYNGQWKYTDNEGNVKYIPKENFYAVIENGKIKKGEITSPLIYLDRIVFNHADYSVQNRFEEGKHDKLIIHGSIIYTKKSIKNKQIP